MGIGIWSTRHLRLVFLFVILGYLTSVEAQRGFEEVADSFNACIQEWTISAGGRCSKTSAEQAMNKIRDKYGSKAKESGGFLCWATPADIQDIFSERCHSGYLCNADNVCQCVSNTPCAPHKRNLDKNCDNEIEAFKDCGTNLCASSSGISPSIIIMFLAAAAVTCLGFVIIRSP